MTRAKLLLTCFTISILVAACGGDKTKTEEVTSPEVFSAAEGIVFASDRDGRDQFYLMTPDGKNTQALNLGTLPANAMIDRLLWVPAWEKFIFSASTGADSEIYTVEQGGRNLVNLTNTPAVFEASPVVSPDGKYIAFVGLDADLDIMVMKSDGSERKNLTQHPARDAAPAWLPDGSLVFSSNRQGTPNIYSIKIDGSELTNISQGPGLDSTFSLAPYGQKIVFDSDRTGNMDLFIVNIKGENPVNLTNSPSREIEPLWSPDGQKIAFRSDKDGGWDLFVVNVDGSSMTNLTDTPDVDELGISWVPDGQHLIFFAKYQGQGEIFVVRLDGTAPANLTKSPANEFSPIWVKFK